MAVAAGAAKDVHVVMFDAPICVTVGAEEASDGVVVSDVDFGEDDIVESVEGLVSVGAT